MKVAIAAFLVVLGCVAVAYIAPSAFGLGGDPLASLSEPNLSDRYTSGFWAKERGRNSDLWTRAVALCGERTAPPTEPLPNCAIVAVVADGGAQERLAREALAERGRVRQWLQNGQPAEISNGLTGRGAKGVPSGFGQPETRGEKAAPPEK